MFTNTTKLYLNTKDLPSNYIQSMLLSVKSKFI